MVSEVLPGGTPGIQVSGQADAQQFLRFHLAPDTTAMLLVQQMTEVLNIPLGQIVPIPHLPAWVMGVYNWRGEILWMVDLGHLIGLAPLDQHATSRPSYQAIVIRSAPLDLGQPQTGSHVSGRKLLGVVVNRVEDMEWCNPDQIESPTMTSVSTELVPFLRGYWLKPTGEMLVALDGEAVIAKMPKPEAIAGF